MFSKFPFATQVKPLGTATPIRILSGSSERWSLFGNHKLAPIPSQETATQGFPFLSFAQENPPSQGAFLAGLGLPS